GVIVRVRKPQDESLLNGGGQGGGDRSGPIRRHHEVHAHGSAVSRELAEKRVVGAAWAQLIFLPEGWQTVEEHEDASFVFLSRTGTELGDGGGVDFGVTLGPRFHFVAK